MVADWDGWVGAFHKNAEIPNTEINTHSYKHISLKSLHRILWKASSSSTLGRNALSMGEIRVARAHRKVTITWITTFCNPGRKKSILECTTCPTLSSMTYNRRRGRPREDYHSQHLITLLWESRKCLCELLLLCNVICVSSANKGVAFKDFRPLFKSSNVCSVSLRNLHDLYMYHLYTVCAYIL